MSPAFQNFCPSLVRERIKPLKQYPKNAFSDLEDVSLYALKFYMVDHVEEDILSFSSLAYVFTLLFKNFSYFLKQFIKLTSMQKTAMISKAASALNTTPQDLLTTDLKRLQFDGLALHAMKQTLCLQQYQRKVIICLPS